MKASVVILTFGPWHEKPWWWDHIEESIKGCNVSYIRIATAENRKEGELTFSHLPRLSVRLIKALKKNKPGYVFTFECGWASFILSAIQTLGFMKSLRHVILQFIMREEDSTLRSKIKYRIMRCVFSSINTAVCSSTAEVSYYRNAFRWQEGRTHFIPFHSDPAYLKVPHDESGGYILTAGRTFRDYLTFMNAVEGVGTEVIVVSSKRNIEMKNIPANVVLKYDISMDELTELIKKSAVVVVPLEVRSISIGQSVFLQAMAMGKAVVATETAGTVDYIDHMESGMLVPPGDSRAMREAIDYLLDNKKERVRLGENARKKVMESYLPAHYAEKVKMLLFK